MTAEHTNRARKAIAIAHALRSAGADSGAARNLDDAGWQLAAKVAAHQVAVAAGHDPEWTDASEATRAIVIEILAGMSEQVVTEAIAKNDELAARQAAADTATVVTGRAVQSSGHQPTADRHDLAIHTDDRTWSLGSIAHCSCGWQDQYRNHREDADKAARMHERAALAGAVDAAIARQHHDPRPMPAGLCALDGCHYDGCGCDPERDADDVNEDAYQGWCITNDMDPDDPAVRAAYADHLDEGYRWAGAGGGR